jgi:uncharacterized protein YjeT (DUF2065 family)
MDDFGVALGLVLVIEGLLYALAPRAMKQAIVAVLAQADERLRGVGLLAAVIGLGVIWLFRG